eukprot:1336499-Prymnesium_polylepis.2
MAGVVAGERNNLKPVKVSGVPNFHKPTTRRGSARYDSEVRPRVTKSGKQSCAPRTVAHSQSGPHTSQVST